MYSSSGLALLGIDKHKHSRVKHVYARGVQGADIFESGVHH